MARTKINETALTRDTAKDAAAVGVYQSGDSSNGMYLEDKGKAGTLVLHFKNTNAAARTVTIKKGVGGDAGAAWRTGVGDLAITVALTSGEQIVWLTDTSRYKQADGTINIDISGTNVTVAAYRLSDSQSI